MAILECDASIVGGHHFVEGREGAVVEFHHHTLQRRQGGRDFEQVQVDRLIGTEHGAGGHTEGEGIADLTGGTGDRYVQGLLHSSSSPKRGRRGRKMAREFYVIRFPLDSVLVL